MLYSLMDYNADIKNMFAQRFCWCGNVLVFQHLVKSNMKYTEMALIK